MNSFLPGVSYSQCQRSWAGGREIHCTSIRGGTKQEVGRPGRIDSSIFFLLDRLRARLEMPTDGREKGEEREGRGARRKGLEW